MSSSSSPESIGQVLLGTRLARTPGVQLAVDLAGLAVVVVIMILADVTSTLAWVAVPGAVLLIAAVRVAIVARRRRNRPPA